MDSIPRMAAPPGTLALVEVLRRSAAYLASAGVSTPRLEAELLLSHALAISRLDLYLQFERPLTQAELVPVRSLLRGRAAGRPLAYLVGEKEFFGLPFTVSEAVLVPRPETELLVELAIKRAAEMGLGIKALDLGCGSGCVGISLAARVAGIAVDAVDSEADAVAVAELNVGRHQLTHRVHIHQGSWADPVRECGPYHLVLSNPPYLTTEEWRQSDPSVREFEPRAALDGGADGLACYRDLIPAVLSVAAQGVTVLLECDPRRISGVAETCRLAWPTAKLTVHPDLRGRERVLEVSLV